MPIRHAAPPRTGSPLCSGLLQGFFNIAGAAVFTVGVCLTQFVLPAAAEDARLSQAREFIDNENFTEASKLLRPITQNDSVPLEAWLLLGAAYEGQGLTKRAISAYEQVMRLNKYHLEGGLGLGRNLVQIRKERSRAVNLYKSLMKVYPDETRLNYALGIAYDEMAEVSYAFDQYKILKDRDPDLAQQLYDVIFMR